MLVRRHDLVRRTEVAMAEQPEGAAKKAPAKKSTAKKGAEKKSAEKKTPAKKNTAKKGTAKKTAPEKTAAPRASASPTASKTTAPRTTKQATKKATAPVQEADRAQKTDRAQQSGAPSGGVLDAAFVAAGLGVRLVGAPVAATRRVLDAKGGLPAYVGAGVLAVTGVVQWPVAAAGTAGYAMLRRWGRRLPEPLRTLTGSAPEQRADQPGGAERDGP